MTEETTNAPEQEQPPATTDPADVDQTAAQAAESAGDKLPENKVTVEDAGTLRKKITVEISRRRIEAKFDEMFGELRRTAQVPGFRIGRAPPRLVEKRFGKEVAEDVRNGLVGEAMGQALEKLELKPIGQPELELDDVKLPEDGDMPFSFEVEVAPQFDLPPYEGVEVQRPTLDVTDERVEQALAEARRPLGRLKPTKAPAGEGDTVVADVSITGDGIEHAEANAEFRVAPGQFQGIPVEDLPKALAGAKAGQSAELKTTVPAAHPNEPWREKEVTIRIDVREVKRMELPQLDEDLAKRMGFTSIEDMCRSVREALGQRLAAEQRRLMRDQVAKYLLEHTSFEVPAQAAKRQANRLLTRRVVDLMMRGVGREEIESGMARLEKAATEQAAQDLKLSFILGKLAEAENIDVDEAEVNARIADIARQQKRRPERLRHEMKNEGTLDTLHVALREEKVIDKVLESAKIADAAPQGPKPPAKAAPAGRKGGSKKKKSTSKKQ